MHNFEGLKTPELFSDQADDNLTDGLAAANFKLYQAAEEVLKLQATQTLTVQEIDKIASAYGFGTTAVVEMAKAIEKREKAT